MNRILLALALAVGFAAVGMATTPAAAGPSKRATAYTIVLASPNPTLGQYQTFTYVVPNVKSPRIQVVCTQGALGVVYAEAQPADQAFFLGGGASVWKTVGGSASCVATLYSWDFNPTQVFVSYASVSFTAAGA